MKIGIIGSGYVGLVSGVCLAHIGHHVICVDNNLEKIKSDTPRTAAVAIDTRITSVVKRIVCCRVGQLTCTISARVSLM